MSKTTVKYEDLTPKQQELLRYLKMMGLAKYDTLVLTYPTYAAAVDELKGLGLVHLDQMKVVRISPTGKKVIRYIYAYDKKCSRSLLDAIAYSMQNDDCSGLDAEDPTLSCSLSIIAGLWNVPDEIVMTYAQSIKSKLRKG